VQHKKRGRPPLKHDPHAPPRPSASETSTTGARRSREILTGPPRPPHLYPNPYQFQTIAPQDMPQHGETRQRDTQRSYPRLASSVFGMYASPSISSTNAPASGIAYYGSGYRPPSSSSSIQTSQPQSPYHLSPFAGTSPEAGPFVRSRDYGGALARQVPTSQSYPPASTSAYHPPLYPRPSAEATLPETRASIYYRPQQPMSSEFQLPPILPAPPGSHTDPAMAQQQLRQSEQQRGWDTGTMAHPGDNTRTTRQPDAKRPRMSLGNIVHPRDEWPRTEG
jgi:hypothetical protein